jgi:ADP-heptose:LPS heptosyltransferase
MKNTDTVYAHGGSALRAGYLTKNRALNAGLRLRDGVWRLSARRAVPAPSLPVNRVLVSVGGHLGDAVIATSVLTALKAKFPNAELGVLCSSANAIVFAGHPLVSRVHRYDHWFTSRTKSRLAGVLARLRGFGSARRRLVRELRLASYDAALELYPFFPNTIAMLARAKIPVRIGYTSGGDGPLLTTALPWRDSREHVAEQHRALLRAWLVAIDEQPWSYDLAPLSDAEQRTGAALLSQHGMVPDNYVVIHPGTGNALKSWPAASWKAVTQQIASELPRLGIVFTGTGPTERTLIDELVSNAPSSISLADQTTWATLRYVISRARIVVGSDSVATHIAAAQSVPSISIMAAMTDPEHWRPGGNKAVGLTEHQPCAPCFNSRGCATMACVRGVSVTRVMKAIHDSLATTSA